SPLVQSVHVEPNGGHIRRIAGDLQAHMARYGYRLIETPIIENADLFLIKAGDQVIERLFTFERRGHVLALRPEFTAAAAYRYAQRAESGVVRSHTVRWQFGGPVFEDNPHDPIPAYQRHSAGAELIGLAGPAADAEIISMAAAGLASLGIDARLVLGHVGLTRHLLARYALDGRTQRFILDRRGLLTSSGDGRAALLQQLDRYFPGDDSAESASTADMPEADAQHMLDVLLDTTRRGETMGGRARPDIARRLLRKRQQAAQRGRVEAALDFLHAWMQINSGPDAAFDQIAPFIDGDATARALLDDWLRAVDLLAAYDISADKLTIRPDLARTWDYYTGPVFELHTGDGLQLGGGGRYDELTRLIGGAANVPAVGFAYYIDRVQQALPTDLGTESAGVSITSQDDIQAARWAQALRSHGLTVTLSDEADAYRIDDGQLVIDGTAFPLAAAAEAAALLQSTDTADESDRP
ncbi:MAG: ATP phosphoribosyltransferase regulatory subunit, partial [Phototrophicaceae bacterium]